MPNQGKNVSFQYGTQNNYDNLTTKDSNTFYITSDTKRIYLGEDLYNMPNCVIPINYYEYNNGENYLLYQGFCEYGADFIATDIYPTEIGKKLMGWDTTPNGSPHFLFENVTSPMSLYPIVQDDPSMCVVTYYSQDGNTILGTEYVNKNENAQGLATNPTKATDSLYKYTFLGWNNASNSTSINSNILNNITQNLDLYAVFDAVIKDDTISDSWEEIIANCNNGTYASKYQIGDLKTIYIKDDINSNGEIYPIQMQVVAINADLLASDDTQTAPVTWISKQVLFSYFRMDHGGQGYLADWATCDIRTYLKNNILLTLPSVVQNNIKEVIKYTNKRTDDTTWTTISTTENIWLPSYREMSNNTSYCEISGVQYNSIFTDDTSRKKATLGLSLSNGLIYWTRSASGNSYIGDANSFVAVCRDGSITYGGIPAASLYKIAIGFCT